MVYAKAPIAEPEAVLAYLSRYTHRVAISNSRLISFDQHGVTIRYKDYRRSDADPFADMLASCDLSTANAFVSPFSLLVPTQARAEIRICWF